MRPSCAGGISAGMLRERNHELAVVLKNDCRRLRIRVVEAKKGHGRKRRPRKSNRSREAPEID